MGEETSYQDWLKSQGRVTIHVDSAACKKACSKKANRGTTMPNMDPKATSTSSKNYYKGNTLLCLPKQVLPKQQSNNAVQLLGNWKQAGKPASKVKNKQVGQKMHQVCQRKVSRTTQIASTSNANQSGRQNSLQVIPSGTKGQIWVKKVKATIIPDMTRSIETSKVKQKVSLPMKKQIQDLQVLLFGMASL